MSRIETRGDRVQVELSRSILSPEARACELGRTAARLLAPGAQGAGGELRAFARELTALPADLQDRVLASIPGRSADDARAALGDDLARAQPTGRPVRPVPRDLVERAPVALFDGTKGTRAETDRAVRLAPAKGDGERVPSGPGGGVAVLDHPVALSNGRPAPARIDERQLLADALRPSRPTVAAVPAAAVEPAAEGAPSPAFSRTVEEALRPALRQLSEEASRFATLAGRLGTAAVRAPLPGRFGERYQAFVASRSLKDAGAAAERMAARAAVASGLEGARGPGRELAASAPDLAVLHARVAEATLALHAAGVPGSGAQASLQELAGLHRSLEGVAGALGLASGRTVLVGGLQAEAHPGPSAPPVAHLATGLTLDDLARVGAALGTPRALPAMAWTAPAVSAVLEAGRRLGVLGPGSVDSGPLAAWALGGNAGIVGGAAPSAPALTELGLLALLRHGGVPLERLDPSQVRAAGQLVAEGRTLPERRDALTRVLDAFQVLARVGRAALPSPRDRRASAARADASPSAVQGPRMATNVVVENAIATAAAAATVVVARPDPAPATTAVAAADFGIGKVFKSIGKAIGGVFKAIGGFFKSIGSAFKSLFNAFLQILPIILTILSFIPITAPFAMIANAALAVYTAVKTKNPLALVGAVASFVGAGAAVMASRVVGTAAATLQRVADVANSVARAMKGIAALREGDIVGGLSAVAGGLASGMGAVAGSAASGLSRAAEGLREIAGKIGTAYQVYQAARRGDLLGAVGLGAGLAADLSVTSPEARAVLARVADGAGRLRNVHAAIRGGNYAQAGSLALGLAADLTDGPGRDLFAQAGQTLGKIATAERLVQAKDYLGAAGEIAETAATYGGSAETRQNLVDTAALLRRIGGAFSDGLRGDYVAAASSLAGLVGPGVLAGAPRLDDGTLAQLQKAAAVFQRAAGIWPALGSGDFRAAEALARELASLFGDDPGDGVRFGQVVSFLHEAASIQDLLRRGEYPGAAARLAAFAPRLGSGGASGFVPTAGMQALFERIAANVADQDALRRALKAGDYAGAAQIAARMHKRIQDETARQALQLGAGTLEEMAAIGLSLDQGDAATASRLAGDLVRWLERNHPGSVPAHARGLLRQDPGGIRAAVEGFASDLGQASEREVFRETVAGCAGGVREMLRTWTHVTRAAERASDLARRFGISMDGLFSANPEARGMDPVPAGTTLVVPEETPPLPRR